MAAISGIVKDSSGTPCAALVRVLRRSDMSLVGQVVSNASTGAYSVTTEDTAPHVVVRHAAPVTDGDVKWDEVVLAMAMDTSTTNDAKGHSATAQGGASIAAISGKNWLYCDGTDDYVALSSYTDFQFGSGPLCIEAEVYMTSATNHHLFSRLTSSFGITYEHGFSVEQGFARVYYGVRGTNQAHIKLLWPTTLTLNASHHVVIQRDALGYWSAYLDGQPATQYQFSPLAGGVSYGAVTNLPYANNVDFGLHTITPSVGGHYAESNTGYIRMVRVTKPAEPRYSGAFTPVEPLFNAMSLGTPTENAQIFDNVTPV